MSFSRTLFLAISFSALLNSCGGGTSSSSNVSSLGFTSSRNMERCSGYTAPNYQDTQWHLDEISAGGVGALQTNATGAGVKVRVIDSGIQIGHCDLLDNTDTEHYDFVSESTGDSTIIGESAHGTSVAGIIGSMDNQIGVSGIAPDATLASYNYLLNVSQANSIIALSRNTTALQIVNNSWGPPDGGGVLHVQAHNVREAIQTTIDDGRGGLGTIHLWAAGNGANSNDNSNYDGYANNRNVIAVAALERNGTKTVYSEPGANLWVSAPAGSLQCTEENTAITTTDFTGNMGYNQNGTPTELANTDFTRCFNGTSAATPVVSGVVAQLLQQFPHLGWRDIRELIARSAFKTDSTDSGWSDNMAGLSFNHTYGFGRIDAQSLLSRASTWTMITEPLQSYTARSEPFLRIPIQDFTTTSNTIQFNEADITQIEQLEIRFDDFEHTYWGDLNIQLVHEYNNQRTVSTLTQTHGGPNVRGQDLRRHVFTSNAHFLEPSAGTWTIQIEDNAREDSGTLNRWSLTFYGR